MKGKWSKYEMAPLNIETTCGVFRIKNGIFANFNFYYKKIRRKVIRRLQNRHIKTSFENNIPQALVSVIVPVYNTGGYIRFSVLSIIKQT